MLRSYLAKDHPLKHLELGSEPTPDAFVANMVRVFALVRETMADHATLWLNIGDTYNQYNANRGDSGGTLEGRRNIAHPEHRNGKTAGNLDAGQLCLIPQRLALALQADGWIVRSVVIWCLSPSTVLYAKTATTEGPMTIHDLVRLDPSTVQLWTGEKWSRVLGWSDSQSNGDALRFTLRSGETISCTAGHQWPLADGRLVRADEIREGDVLTTCQLPEPANTEGDGLEELAWFAGLYLAEGSRSDDCISIAGHSRETERHEKVATIARKYGGTSTLHCDGDTATLRVHGMVLHGAIDHFVAGRTAKDKHLNPRAWRSNNAVLLAFLMGYLKGDGHWDGNNRRWRVGFCRNVALAQTLRTLCARLGVTLTLNATYSKMGRTKIFESYRGEIRFDPPSGHHNERSRAEVVKIERGWPGTYYDIGIEDEPHTFALASGVLTHNSKPAPMPASLAGWMWKRCRVKVKEGGRGGNGHARMMSNATPADVSRQPNTEWSDCPGCKKCEKANGLVLRRGSWRPTSSYEPVLMLAKSSNYFCDGEAVKQPPAAATVSRDQYTRVLDDPDEQFAVKHDHETICDGANLRDVWTIASEPLKEKHYAAFPSELVTRCLKAATSAKGYCPTCGSPWARVVESLGFIPTSGSGKAGRQPAGKEWNAEVNGDGSNKNLWQGTSPLTQTLGWRATCPCPPAEPRAGRVLDPFCGSGRTAIVANLLGLDFTGVELNPDYVQMSERLIKERMGLFAAVPPEEPT